MKLILILFLFKTAPAMAGAVFICDNYGHRCLAGQPSCDRLIPPLSWQEDCMNESFENMIPSDDKRTEAEIADLLHIRSRDDLSVISTQGWNPECYDKGPLCDK